MLIEYTEASLVIAKFTGTIALNLIIIAIIYKMIKDIINGDF